MAESESTNLEAEVKAMGLVVDGQEVAPEAPVELTQEALAEAKRALNVIFDQIFTKHSLETDEYLQAAISPSLTLPLNAVLGVPRVREVSTDPSVVRSVLQESGMVDLDASNDVVKLNIKLEQNTVILRDIPSKTSEEEIKAIFNNVPSCPELQTVRSDIGDTWYVTFATEADARVALNGLSACKFNEKSIKCRLKVESIKKSFFSSPTYGSGGTPGSGGGPGPAGFFGEPAQMQVPQMPMPAGMFPYFPPMQNGGYPMPAPGYPVEIMGPGGQKMWMPPQQHIQGEDTRNQHSVRRGGKVAHRGAGPMAPGQPGWIMPNGMMGMMPMGMGGRPYMMPRPYMVPQQMGGPGQQQQGQHQSQHQHSRPSRSGSTDGGSGQGSESKGKGGHKQQQQQQHQRIDGANGGMANNRGQQGGASKMRDGSSAQQGGEGGERKKAPKKKKNASAGENGSVGGDEPVGRRSPRSSDGTRNTGGKAGAQTSDAASSKGSKPVKKGPNFNMEADFPTLGDDFPGMPGMAVGGSMVEVEATQGDAPTLAPAPAATVPVATQTSPKSAAQGAWAAAVLGGKEKPEGDAGLPEATPISTKGTQTSASTKSAETQLKPSEASDVSFGGVRAAKTQTKDGNGNESRQSTPSSAGDAASKSANKAENAKQVSVPVTFGSFDETTPDTTKVEAAGDVPSNADATDAGGSVSVWGMKKSFSDVLKQAGRN